MKIHPSSNKKEMATDETSLLQPESRKMLKKLKKLYSESVFKSKGGILVIVWITTVLLAGLMLVNPILVRNTEESFLTIGLAQFTFILFPFFGYLGERYPRHQLLLAGTILTVIGFTVNFLVVFLQGVIGAETSGIETKVFGIISTLAVFPGYSGYGLCYSNFLQFGTTQLQFSSSSMLQAYVRWLTLSSVSTGIVALIIAGLQSMKINLYLIANGVYLMIMIIVGVIIYILRHEIIKESPPAIDPLKLIYKVMRYAKQHNHPVRPSAFTYNGDPPSRLDFAKTRYGGPFTTQQVEEVKSFWYLFLIPLCHLLNTALFISVPLSRLYMTCIRVATSISATIILTYPIAIIEGVAVICIIILQLIIVPCCPNRIPTLIKRIWLGLFLVLISAIVTAIISHNVIVNLDTRNNNDDSSNSSTIGCIEKAWPYYVILVPDIMSGTGLFFSLTSQLELILAQAPHSMQGLLIGITYMQFAVPFGLSFGYTVIGHAEEKVIFYYIITVVQLFCLISYSITAYKYKYRQPNELADINVRDTIEEIYKRELDQQQEIETSSDTI